MGWSNGQGLIGDEDLDSLSIPELVSFLGSSSEKSDYDRVERILVSREAALMSENEKANEELSLKEVKLMELASKCDSSERDLDALRSQCSQLEDRARSSSLEIEKYKRICAGFEDQTTKMRDEYRMLSERYETAIRDRSCTVNEIEGWKRRLGKLKATVSELVVENSSLRAREDERDQKLEEAKGNGPFGESSGKTKEDEDWKIKVLPKQDARIAEKPVFSGVIVISDSEDEMCFDPGSGKGDPNMQKAGPRVEINSPPRIKAMRLDKEIVSATEDDDDGGEEDRFISILTPKRKLHSRVVTSDSENEDDEDRVPIGKLKMRRVGEVAGEESNLQGNRSPGDGDCITDDATASRRRLVRLGECKEKSIREKKSPSASVALTTTPINRDGMAPRRRATMRRKLEFSDNEDCEEEEEDAIGSESEGESLGGFIVDEPKGEESEYRSDGLSSSSSEEFSDTDFHEALAKIRRQKDIKGWKYEADMLSAFSRDPELCMKAVCALYRQQTSEERSFKNSFLVNNRGFNKYDAQRGSMMAEFLLDGNMYGPLKKSVDDLQKYNPRGPDYCLQVARKYSKQLFAIYENREDLFFLP